MKASEGPVHSAPISRAVLAQNHMMRRIDRPAISQVLRWEPFAFRRTPLPQDDRVLTEWIIEIWRAMLARPDEGFRGLRELFMLSSLRTGLVLERKRKLPLWLLVASLLAGCLVRPRLRAR